jgi:hypothetical protein
VEGDRRVLRRRELGNASAQWFVADDVDLRGCALRSGEREEPAVDCEMDVRVTLRDGREEREDDHVGCSVRGEGCTRRKDGSVHWP